jgi:hypothetical protein
MLETNRWHRLPLIAATGICTIVLNIGEMKYFKILIGFRPPPSWGLLEDPFEYMR